MTDPKTINWTKTVPYEIGDIVKNHDGTLLKCVDPRDAIIAMLQKDNRWLMVIIAFMAITMVIHYFMYH